MVIATKPKPRQTVHHKKRAGQHQRQTKHYMKTYWPYLPMIAAATCIDSIVAKSDATTFATTTSANRIEAWTNAGPWLTILVAAVCILSLVIVVTRHTLAWQRVITKSEDFFIHHHTFDVLLVGVVLAGIIVTRH